MPATKKRSMCSPAAPGIRYWLVDTGCPVDLIGIKSMPEKFKDHVYKSEDPQDFDTANGSLPADKQVNVQVEGIPRPAEPYTLEESFDVLTVGKRCVREGYGFHWPPCSIKPYFYLPWNCGGGRLPTLC